MRSFFFVLLLVTFSAQAETWTCSAYAHRVFPAKGFLDETAPVASQSNPGAKSPKIAAIRGLDQAFRATADGVCKVEETLNRQHKDNWPSRYAWIHHWKFNEQGQASAVVDYFPNTGADSFEQILAEAVTNLATHTIPTDVHVLGCYYECSTTPKD